MGANQRNSLFHFLVLLLEYTIREVQESIIIIIIIIISSSSSNSNNNLLHSTHFLTCQFIRFKMPTDVSHRVTATACN